MTHQHFQALLATACPSSGADAAGKEPDQARVQWDPERSPRSGKLDYRSIQIGIPAARCLEWAEEQILSIEDVTTRARELKRVLDDDSTVTVEDLEGLDLMPQEKPYPLPESLARHLRMIE